MCPLFNRVQVPLDDVSSFCCVNCTTQLSAVSKLAQGTLNPTAYVIDKDAEEYIHYKVSYFLQSSQCWFF